MTRDLDFVAAWVPERADMDWDEAVSLAIDWIREQRGVFGGTPVLVTNAMGVASGPGRLGEFARSCIHVTPRSARAPRGVSPVLAYVPDPKALELATDLARGSALCAVEGFLNPLAGWAAAVAAENLLGDCDAPDLDEELIEHLVFFGNNGYGSPFDRQQATRYLERAMAAGGFDVDVLVGALAARGVSARGQKNLRKLVEKLER